MYLIRVLAIVSGVALTAALSPAQQGGTQRSGGTAGGTTGGTTGGTGTGGTTTGGNTGRGAVGTIPGNTSSYPDNTSPFPSDIARPIFLSGKVVMSDGSALSTSVIIERVCNGNPRPEAHTDSKGRFSFQLGQNQELFMDLESSSSGRVGPPNQSQGIRERDLAGCDLRASLPGYRSDLIPLANHRYMDNPDIGTIILHRLGNVEGLTISATSARAPKDARKAYEKGLEAAKKNKFDEAQKELEKAVETYPQYASAWFDLGRVYEQRDQVDQARKAYAQALAADSKYINPYERLYMLAFKEAKWQELADTTDHVLRLNPFDFPSAYYFNAVANLQLNKLDIAEKSAREAVKLDTGHRNPKTNYVLGLVLAQKRDFTESSEYLRAYLKAAPNASDAAVVRKQLEQTEKFAQAAAQPPPQN